MIDKLKHIIQTSTKFNVLGIYNTTSGFRYSLIKVLLKNDELKIIDRQSFNSLEDISVEKVFDTNAPVLLHLETSQVINKSSELKPNYRKDLIFKADLDAFYFYEFEQEKTIYVSVIRKENLRQHITSLNNLGLHVVNVSFGPFVIANILTYLKAYKEVLTPLNTISLNQGKIEGFDSNVKENGVVYNVNGENISQEELPLIAAFFNHNYPTENIEFDTYFLNKDREEVKFKKWFKIGGLTVLIFTLLALIISHLLLGNYLKDLAKKETTYLLAKQTNVEINKLLEKKKLKEKILQTSGMSQNTIITKYVVDVGNITPKSIALRTLNVNPLIKKIKPNTEIRFYFNLIEIKGVSFDDLVFNTWVKKLKGLDWVKKIEITDYYQEGTTKNSFAIKIEI